MNIKSLNNKLSNVGITISHENGFFVVLDTKRSIDKQICALLNSMEQVLELIIDMCQLSR